MTTIRVSELNDILAQLPDTDKFTQPLGKTDIFLCALGFEPRCLSIPKRLASLSFRADHAVYLEPSTNRTDNAANLPELKKSLSVIGSAVESLQADQSDFSDQLHRLISALKREPYNLPSVVFDISVAANRGLMRTMKVLLEMDIDLTILYSEAETYHPTRQEFENYPDEWLADATGLESGVSDVFPSTEYPGQHLDPSPDYLILFPSFKAERSRAVIARVDPSLLAVPSGKVCWLVGLPHHKAIAWRMDAMRKLNGITPTTPQYEVSTFDYKDSLARLQKIYLEKWEHYNITVCPLGSKMQAVGTSLFCFLHPDVRLMIAVPKQYNSAHYSEGCADHYVLNFGSTAELRQKLETVGTLSIVD